jgi:hypothetical protein
MIDSIRVRLRLARCLASLLVLMALSSFSITSARATTLYSLNSSACCGSGPFGEVTLTQTTSSQVSVLVTLDNPYLYVDTGQAGAFTFNLANVPFANLAFSINAASMKAGFSGIIAGNGTFDQHMAGFGFFDYAINGDTQHTSGGSTPIGQTLSFTVTNTSGNLPISDFLEISTGSTPSFFSADVFGNGLTGFVGVRTSGASTSSVPEPSTWAAIGFGLLGLALLGSRKRR